MKLTNMTALEDLLGWQLEFVRTALGFLTAYGPFQQGISHHTAHTPNLGMESMEDYKPESYASMIIENF